MNRFNVPYASTKSPTPTAVRPKVNPFGPHILGPGTIGQGGTHYPDFQSGYGASFRNDPHSGKPLLRFSTRPFRSTILPDRVATTFDITRPQKLTRDILSNGRMPLSASMAIRKELGLGLDEQLDHAISLQLSGSNLRENLAGVKENERGVQPLVGLENELGRKVIKGEISLLEAQRALARAKGFQLKEDIPKPTRSEMPKPEAEPDNRSGFDKVLDTVFYDAEKNPFQKLAKGAVKLGRDVLQGTARSFLGTTLTAFLDVTGDQQYETYEVPEALRPVFGTDKIKNLGSQVLDLESAIKHSPFAQKHGLDEQALPLAFGGVVLSTGLDLSIFPGGEGAAFKAIAKTESVEGVAKILRRIGLKEEFVEKFAPSFAAMKYVNEVKDALKVLKSVQGTKVAAERAALGNISKDLEPLAVEAKKYKSAEEFVKNQPTFYRGGKEGNWVSPDPYFAKEYGKVTEYSLAKKPNFLSTISDEADEIANKLGADSEDLWFNPSKELDIELKQRGYDGFVNGADGENIYLVDRAILKTKSQLTDLYNQAVKQTENEGEDVVALARDDWEKNFAERHQALFDEGADIGRRLHEAPVDKKGAIAEELTDLSNKQQLLEDEFLGKWGGEATPALRGVKEAGISGGPEATFGLQREATQGTLPRTGAEIKTPGESLLSLPKAEQASFKPIVDETLKTVKNKVHAMDYFATPEFVLERIGLGKESKMLHDAFDSYRADLKVQIGKIVEWKKEVAGIPEASEHIFRYLDGTPGMTLTETEKKVAEEMRHYLSDWADRLHLPKDSRIANYITHIFESDFLKKEFDPDLAKLITDRIPGSVYDPFLEKRLGIMGYKQDAFGALDAYVKRATRKVAMDPALQALKEAGDRLDIESQQYVMRLAGRINLRPTEMDNLLDNLIKSTIGYKFGTRPVTQISKTIRTMIYRGTLGLNFGSALRNLTQGANTYAKLGEKYTVVGYSKLFSRMVTGNMDELVKSGILEDALIQDRKVGVYKTLLQKMDTGLFKMFDMAEKINRGAAYFGAKSKAINRGATEAEAIQIAKRVVRETQFAFGNIDSPVIMSSDIAKTVFQLQSYNIKQIEFLKNMVKNKEFAGLVRWTIGSFGMVYTIGRIFGMKPSDIIPTFRLGGSPLGNALGIMAGLVSPDEKKREESRNSFDRVLATIIPAGMQIRKSLQGLKAYNEGKDVTPTGRTRFKIRKTPVNFLRATLFGKSSLPAAQEYYSSLGKKEKVGNRFSQ